MLSIAGMFASMAMLAGETSTQSNLVVENCEFGEAYAFSRAECTVTLQNQGDKPIKILEAKPKDAADTARLSSSVVAARSKAYLSVAVGTGNGVANVRHIFYLWTNESGHEKRLAIARGFVSTVLDQPRPAFDFGVVDLRRPPKSMHIELASHDVAGFRIDKVVSVPEYVDAKLAADGLSLDARLRADAPWGFRIGYIKLKTNTAVQPEVWVGVQADIHGEVVASANPFDMGLMRTGNRNEKLITLTQVQGKGFRVGKIDVADMKAATGVLPCTPAKPSCRLLRLIISDDQPLGTLKGHVDVEFPDYGRTMRVALWGLLIDKNTQIEKLDAKDAASGKPANSVSTQNVVDLGSAIKQAVAAAEEPDPPGTGPLLKWTVANQMLIYGYQIFRGPSEKGPFLLVNPKTILSNSKTNAETSYKWRDDSAQPGRTYWYYIGLVYNDGHKQQLTGPQKVVAK